MFTLLLSLILLACVLLVLVILAQNSKGGGLSSQFGGAGASNMIGVKKTGDLLEKLTWGFIIVIMTLSIGTNFLPKNKGISTDSFIERASGQQNAAPSLDLGIDEADNSEEGETIDMGDLESEPATEEEGE